MYCLHNEGENYLLRQYLLSFGPLSKRKEKQNWLDEQNWFEEEYNRWFNHRRNNQTDL